MISIADTFLKIRADNLSPDSLFSEFVVPPFLNTVNFLKEDRTIRILGGRGCGKTMFVRYFSHGSWLNPKRTGLSDDELQRIGLYFRPDTGFCGLMSAAWLGARDAQLAFSHYVALNALVDACDAVQSVGRANLAAGPLEVGDPTVGSALATQLGLTDSRVSALRTLLDVRLAELEMWVRNPKRSAQPIFVSFASVVPRFAEDLAQVSPRLSGLSFRLFIDEFENLPEAHREVVCDAIKHPKSRLVVHIAHKKEAVTDFKTSSDERVVEIHDLTTFDLEEHLSKDRVFQLLAAELFLLRLHQAGGRFDCPLFVPERLHDVRDLPVRSTDAYSEQVLRCVRAILPMPSAGDLAGVVMADAPLRRRLRTMLQKGLELHKAEARYAVDSLIRDADTRSASASVVLGALLNRKNQDADGVIRSFEASIAGVAKAEDPFFKVGGWVDNNLHGCLFHLYAGLPRRKNINYAGFDRFCAMATPNLRFFQALCHTTLRLQFQDRPDSETSTPFKVSYETQADAARQVSDSVFENVFELGSYGSQLLEVTGRLGKVFEAFNRRRSQSEPEINHFSIDNADRSELSDEAWTILREAKIWSVLYQENDTKNKQDYDVAQTDLVLNPIFAPHFGISYRKRRKVTLQAGEVDVMLCQSTAQFDAILKRLVDPGDQPSNESQQLF